MKFIRFLGIDILFPRQVLDFFWFLVLCFPAFLLFCRSAFLLL